MAGGQRLGFLCAELIACGLILEICSILRSARLRTMTTAGGDPFLRDGVLTIRRDPLMRAFDIVSTATFGAGALLFAVGAWRDAVHISLASESAENLYPPVAFVVGMLYIGNAVRVANRDSAWMSVSERGISVPSHRTATDLDWGIVTEVTPVLTKGDKRNGAWISVRPGERYDEIRVDESCLGGPATFWLIDFYHRHPELRAELGGTAVIRRLRDRSLVPNEHRNV
ncbi:hypothetical protein [Gordonia sp. SL306]|uniref:hypothetical protein n=1 Tax=Gordonia sp. SL306 TaxID=2995145 RepID=UPI00226F2E02|nr:hypothetical protein [Gordonia sp. SL306]WAC56047.1 hypothetical protein OVA31_01910 [Gordonia sp. SL306]